MTDFRRLSDSVSASPQIDVADVERARELGFAMIVNNRPDGESGDQTPSADIEARCRELGLQYRGIPISAGNFGAAEVEAMDRALSQASGPVLAYCRTGTRSTLLWSLVQARHGRAPQDIAADAAAAGYDISPIGPAMVELARQHGG